MLYNVNPQTPQARIISIAVASLKKGGIIAYPTDTFYGIGCDIMNKNAIEKIYRIKQREKTKPFSFICPDLKNISQYAKVSNIAYRHMKRLLPGPYTFILPGSKMVPKIMLTKRKTAGIRVPANPIAISLAQELGNPIISTSATDPDGKVFEDASLLHDYFDARLDMVLDGGPVPNAPSSVISLVEDEPEVIRHGAGEVDLFE
ncbi:threonylcarbamoyl-AMP synthase [Desulfobacter hydrogenophilus]|uniref:Threonylcarbamoyl-AMP synthase n=1 Tax=Desulfobacter hydrogenophilus TaxID=2291 RepID=A0A328FCG3_9BACT|nr:L-threonylcarbamoyladenylate synthase [Desulfobacter hydrogenophilus]NDY73468.1 threonylcarbamoyl-AMP synthase [Desulfobacter hydrogenophilus]QBH14406.1 threonylcarbamoyl-AMP synthase [Desulfobacter hydrogenophilus]RAM02268.1 threonylcarbamoyl-AMP synthase [Desulfobacter hydrogenophilus]